MEAIKDSIRHYKRSVDHDRLLGTIMMEMNLKGSREQLSEVKQSEMVVEHSTGQHTWDNYIARDGEPKTDGELSPTTNGLRIHIASIHRGIEVALIWVELLLESLIQDEEKSADRKLMLEWIRNLKT